MGVKRGRGQAGNYYRGGRRFSSFMVVVREVVVVAGGLSEGIPVTGCSVGNEEKWVRKFSFFKKIVADMSQFNWEAFFKKKSVCERYIICDLF